MGIHTFCIVRLSVLPNVKHQVVLKFVSLPFFFLPFARKSSRGLPRFELCILLSVESFDFRGSTIYTRGCQLRVSHYINFVLYCVYLCCHISCQYLLYMEKVVSLSVILPIRVLMKLSEICRAPLPLTLLRVRSCSHVVLHNIRTMLRSVSNRSTLIEA